MYSFVLTIKLQADKAFDKRTKDAFALAKLRQIVSSGHASDSYKQQIAIGDGSSSSVFLASIRQDAPSPSARMVLQKYGSAAQAVIKRIDLCKQERVAYIVNELIVMQKTKHQNVIGLFDAFLQEQEDELWIVMEYMNGGTLTDLIENCPQLGEDHISAICKQVRTLTR
jgi:protein-serine/threonine kinase